MSEPFFSARLTSRFTFGRGSEIQTGSVSLIFVLCLFMMLGAVGVAIDGGRAYMVQSKLNAAVDAICIPAARGVSLGIAQAERSSNAQTAAHK